MKLRLLSVELWRQRRRVRRAEQIVRHDQAAMSLARERFMRDVVATPVGLATCGALGFAVDRIRAREPAEGGGFVSRLGSVVSLALWLHRLVDEYRNPPANA